MPNQGAKKCQVPTPIDPRGARFISARSTNPHDTASESPLKHLALMIPPVTNIWRVFNPDGNENAYYMEETELSFHPEEISVREHVAAHMPSSLSGTLQ
jgi:hypothetical protein